MKKDTDFPQTLQDTIHYFADTDRAREFVATIRWPGGKARNMNKQRKARVRKASGYSGMTPVVGLLERGTAKRASRIKLEVVKGVGMLALDNKVREYVIKGTEVITDGNRAYRQLQDEYTHNVIDHAVSYVRGHVHTNGLENFWSLLKRTIRGTYVSVEPFHLFRYLDEQAFRFNERKATDGWRFMQAVRSIVGKRLTYKHLIGADELLGSTPA